MRLKLLLLPLLWLSAANFCRAQVVINEICPANGDINHDLKFYNFSGWVELYNSGSVAVNLGGYFLSDNSSQLNKWRIPSGTSLGSKQYLLIWCDGKNSQLHSNFELDAEGEEVILSKSTLAQEDKLVFPSQFINVSYGRTSDGGSTIGYLIRPTPGSANIGETGTERLVNPEMSIEPGRYSGSQNISISHPDADAEIRFTTNGSEPTSGSPKFSAAFSVSKTTTVKAKAFKSGFIPSKTEVATYFIGEHTFGLPVISLSMNQSYLTDNTIGIYTDGTNGVTGYCQDKPFNWNQDWSRHAVMEFFDKSGKKEFDQSIDIRIGGNCSRSAPLKSFVIKARDEYGKNTVDEKLFESKDWSSYGGFMLRNAGNDFWNTMFRDELMQKLASDQMDLDYLAYQPKAIYLNGAYWGILNLREKIDADYFETNYGVDKDDLDLIEGEWALEGSATDYVTYVNNLASMDLSTQQAFEYIDANIDVQEYINYFVTEIYFCNTDWPGNNIKFWRKRGGKWRWVLWDLDFGMGLYTNVSYPTHPTLNFATETNGPVWPNPPWSTRHFRLLLQNPEFKKRFIGTFSAALSSTFEPQRVIEEVDIFQNNIKNEMPFHISRWEQSTVNWTNEVQRLKNFATERHAFMNNYLKDFFGLGDQVKINVTAPAAQGKVKLNGVASDDIENAPYFRGIEYTVVAEPETGYRFSRWNITRQESKQINLISRGSSWKYFDDGVEPSPTWEDATFDDSSWQEANAQFGYGEDDEQTIVSYGSDPNNKYITTYFRKSITVTDTTDFVALSGKALFDDGIVIYLNGEEVFRGNMPAGAINNTTLATIAANENVYESFTIPKGKIKPGLNSLAVEIHQNGATSSDVSFDLELSTAKLGDATTTTSNVASFTDIANSDVTMEAFFVPVQASTGLIINEFSAVEGEHLDEQGEAEDWIEIYNNGTQTIDLAGLYITDNLSNKQKYQIRMSESGTTIAPGEYKILYADEELFDGPLHVNFKLSADGESIGLYQKIGADLQVIDQLNFEQQTAGTYSRIPNLTGPFVITAMATPLDENIYEAIVANEGEVSSKVAIYPNPTRGVINIQSTATILNVMLFDLNGRVLDAVRPYSIQHSLSLQNQGAGIYLLQIQTTNGMQWRKIIKSE